MNISLTFSQNQRFVGIDTLHDAEVGRSLQGQFDSSTLQDAHELIVVHNHFAAK